MALPEFSLRIINQIVTELRQADGTEPKRVMSLGYPDILAHPDRVRTIFDLPDSQTLEYHLDSQAIVKWHNVSTITEKIVESRALFSLLGFQLDVLDIVKARGDETIVDLNEPCSQEFEESYDLIIDTGTLEHCFNVGQAMKNMAGMVRKDGIIFQNTPLNWFNHGFYNFNPTFYYDFYQENGFKLEIHCGVANIVFNAAPFQVPPYKAFQGIPDRSSNIVVAKRIHIQPIKWPVQTKYKKNPQASWITSRSLSG